MRSLVLALALPVVQLVAAHTVFTTLFVNDVNQGDGTCIRMNMTPNNSTFPVNDLASNDMACGYDGTLGVARVCSVSQGSKLTFLWREWADGSNPGSIDASHKGPCAVYMKAVSSVLKDTGYGVGWVKIWDSGYDFATSQWCTETLIQNNGLLSVDIPSDISGGYYLVRPELLALHQADKTPPNPQFYVGCAQIFLQSSGTAVPTDTVTIPGYVHAGDPSVDFNIYTPSWPYVMPGPMPYVSSSRIKSDAKVVTPSDVQTEGLVPRGCVLSNANWCGIELDPYSTEAGCWNASTVCFQQDTLCYSSAPPTGSKNCDIWEAKCDAIQAGCNAGNFNGPPDYGKDLNPLQTISYKIPSAAIENADLSSIFVSTFTLATTSLLVASMELPSYTPDTTDLVSLVTDTFTQSSLKPTLQLLTVTDTLSESMSVISTMAAITIPRTIPEITISTSSAAMSPSNTGAPARGQNTTFPISLDATCGPKSNHACLGSSFGSCCSQWNWCGTTDAYCGAGCQSGYGTCANPLVGKEKSSAHLKKHRGRRG